MPHIFLKMRFQIHYSDNTHFRKNGFALTSFGKLMDFKAFVLMES